MKGRGVSIEFASDETVDRIRQEALSTLQRCARDLKAYTRAERSANLEIGKILCEVLDRPMSVWDVPPSKLPDGELRRVAAWAKREADLSYSQVANLTRAHRVFTTVKTAEVEPTHERQLRPLTKLLTHHADQIPAIWEKACAEAKREDGNPTAAEVRRAAKQAVPEAFKTKKKGKKSKAGTLRALHALREECSPATYRAALEQELAALKEAVK